MQQALFLFFKRGYEFQVLWVGNMILEVVHGAEKSILTEQDNSPIQYRQYDSTNIYVVWNTTKEKRNSKERNGTSFENITMFFPFLKKKGLRRGWSNHTVPNHITPEENQSPTATLKNLASMAKLLRLFPNELLSSSIHKYDLALRIADHKSIRGIYG